MSKLKSTRRLAVVAGLAAAACLALVPAPSAATGGGASNPGASGSTSGGSSLAPVLSVSVQTLHWTGSARHYIIERKPGPSFIEVGPVDEYTPATDPGHADYFRVRYKSYANYWSNEVSITYPPEGETQKQKEEREAREKAEREAKEKAEREQKEREERERIEKEKAKETGLPTHFAWGIGNVSNRMGWMVESGSKWDFANDYLSAGANTTGGWEHWGNGAGTYASRFAEKAHADGYVPVLSYYNLYQSNGSCEGCGEANKDFSNLNNTSTMNAYYANFRLALERLAPYEHSILHVEPDLSGYVEQAVLTGSCDGFCTGQGNDPALMTAAVASSGYAPVAGYANTYEGFSEALKHLRDVYAPKVLLAFHVSGWATRTDIDATTQAVSGTERGKEAGEFAAKAGAGSYDVIFNDVANHDAGNGGNWWDQLNVSVPNFARWESYVKAISEATGKKVIVWQVPEGNQFYDTMSNATGHWQDNRAEYFFGHVAELVEHDLVGVIFGDGTAGTKVWDSVGDGITNPASFCTKSGLSSGEVCDNHLSLFADDDGGFIRERGLLYYANPYPLP